MNAAGSDRHSAGQIASNSEVGFCGLNVITFVSQAKVIWLRHPVAGGAEEELLGFRPAN